MNIAVGHARLKINQTTETTKAETAANESVIAIKVVQGSLSGIFTSALAAAALIASFSF